MNDIKICIEKNLPEHHDELKEIHHNTHSDLHKDKLKAAFYSKKIWPLSTKVIKICFLEDPPSNIKRTTTREIMSNTKIDPLQYEIEKTNMPIKDAIKLIVKERIQPLVPFNYEFVDTKEDAYIRITFNPNNGAWAMLGTDCKYYTDINKPTMNLGWFDVATTIHEFCHTLGMIHEHQNPRGKSIDWNLPKLYEWTKRTQGWDEKITKTNIVDKYDLNSINGSDFDPNSIMLYFYPKELTLDNTGTTQNLEFSFTDIKWIVDIYNSKINPQEFYDKIYYNQEVSFFSKNKEIILILFIIFILILIK